MDNYVDVGNDHLGVGSFSRVSRVSPHLCHSKVAVLELLRAQAVQLSVGFCKRSGGSGRMYSPSVSGMEAQIRTRFPRVVLPTTSGTEQTNISPRRRTSRLRKERTPTRGAGCLHACLLPLLEMYLLRLTQPLTSFRLCL